jgi:Phosphate transport (Pho88)
MVPAPPPSPFAPPAPAVTTDGADPGAPADDEDAKDKPSTVLEYDLNLLQTARKSWLMNAVILTLVHMKTASVSPLLMSTIMGLTRYLDDPLFKLHILGFRSDGPLKRPFPVDKNPLAGLLQGMLPEAHNPSTESDASGPSSASRSDLIRRTQQYPPAYVEDLHEDDEDEDDEDDEHAPPVSLLEQDNPHDNDFDSDGPAADEPKKSK